MTEVLTCAHCGLELVGASNDPSVFEPGEEVGPPGPIFHPKCAEAAFLASPGDTVLTYPEGQEPGPLTP